MNKGKFIIVGIVMSLFVLYGCSTTQPMTKKIYSQASSVGKVDNFQYYVSRNIILTRTEDAKIVGKVDVSGKLEITSTKEIIQIPSSTMGALLKTEKDSRGNIIYYVAFETDNDNCLRFVQKKAGNEERIYLLYDDEKSNAIRYGNAVYTVGWKGVEGVKTSRTRAKTDNFFSKLRGKFKGVTTDENDNPYLLVKIKTKFKEEENYRKASGRKVEVD